MKHLTGMKLLTGVVNNEVINKTQVLLVARSSILLQIIAKCCGCQSREQ